MVTFTTTHFSKFAVVYVTRTFNDLESAAWAKAIEVLASGILKGITETVRSSNAHLEGGFPVLAHKARGRRKVDENFDDIDKNAYYYRDSHCQEARHHQRHRNNKFSPDRPITRQDMMVLARDIKNT